MIPKNYVYQLHCSWVFIFMGGEQTEFLSKASIRNGSPVEGIKT